MGNCNGHITFTNQKSKINKLISIKNNDYILQKNELIQYDDNKPFIGKTFILLNTKDIPKINYYNTNINLCNAIDLIYFFNDKIVNVEQYSKDDLINDWNKIVWNCGGSILPIYTAILDIFRRKYMLLNDDNKNKFMLVIVSDGKLLDIDKLLQSIKILQGKVYVKLLLLDDDFTYDKLNKLKHDNIYFDVINIIEYSSVPDILLKSFVS